jgi:hypothetical protein
MMTAVRAEPKVLRAYLQALRVRVYVSCAGIRIGSTGAVETESRAEICPAEPARKAATS